MLALELHTRDIPELFSRFAALIGEEQWQRRVANCDSEIRGNVYLRDFLHEENAIAYQLDHLSALFKRHRGSVPIASLNDPRIYSAATFIAQILSFVAAIPTLYADRFSRRVAGALNNPDDMRGLLLELMMATHFFRRGHAVSWPEITGADRFDLLVEDIGPNGLEVECKSVSKDKGSPIHRREMCEFFHLADPRLSSILTNLRHGLYIVLTLPEGIPKQSEVREQLVDELCQAVLHGRGGDIGDGANVRLGDFDPGTIDLRRLQRATDHEQVRVRIDNITGTANRHLALFSTRAGGVVILALQSFKDGDPLKATFATLKTAARKQLTGSRAGVLMAEICGVTTEEMRSIVRDDRQPGNVPTLARQYTSRFLASASRPHVVGVGLLSNGSYRSVGVDVTQLSGAAYFFPKRESAYWSKDFGNLFDWEIDDATVVHAQQYQRDQSSAPGSRYT